MKTQKTTTLLILLVFSVCGYTQNTEITKVPEHPTSEDSITFFGKIKSVRETSYEAVEKFGEVSKGEKLSIEVFKCDNKKNLIEYEYGQNDRYIDIIVYREHKTIIKYDNTGKKIEKKTYADEKLDSTITWKYNDKGSVIEKNTYDTDNNLFGKTKWKYNDKNKLIEEGYYDSLGNAVSKEIKEYDARGYYTGHTKYENGKLAWKCTHQLDDRGNQIHNVRVGYHYDGSDIDTFFIKIFKRDEFGNIIEWDEYQRNQLSRKVFYKYNEDKVKIEGREFFLNMRYTNYLKNLFCFYSSNGKPTLWYGSYYTLPDFQYWYEKYDEKGNLIECLEKWYDECESPIIDEEYGEYSEQKAKEVEEDIKNRIKDFDTKTEYVYTFDTYGNWVTKTTYEQNKNSMPTCTGIVEREIEYYETD